VRVAAPSREPPADDGPAAGAAEAEAVRLHAAVAFCCRGDSVELQAPVGGATLEFPLRLLPVVTHFSSWRPLASVFTDVTGDDGHQAQLEAFALVRELLQQGVLVRRAEHAAGLGDGGGAWEDWRPSLPFYLASRTLEDQLYPSHEELEEQLRDKATTEPQPSGFKEYGAARFSALENPFSDLEGPDRDRPFVDVLVRRRTTRAFRHEPLTKEQLSKLLFFTWGATTVRRNTMGEDVFVTKTSPSGGSLHGAEVYPILMDVEGLSSGVYHYSVRRHGLELLASEDPRPWIAEACGGQAWVRDAAAVFLSTCVLDRLAWKYRSPRALRVAFQDIGHLSQTLCLVATWLGLGSFTTGALRDEIFEKKIGLRYLQEPVVLLNGAGTPASDLMMPPAGFEPAPRP
jgi:SagB-type dehydrogenase family enzyme